MKPKFNYFAVFEEMAEQTEKAANYLKETLATFKPGDLSERTDAMHAIEHAADQTKHGMMERLAREFVAPIEREDIIDLAEKIDDVTDAVDDVLIKMYMYNIRAVREDAVDFVDVIVACCKGIRRAMAEFKDFHHSKTIRQEIIEINRLEEVGDRLYISAVRGLYTSGIEMRDIMGWTEMYACLEACCDACEHVADTVESVIMKNT